MQRIIKYIILDILKNKIVIAYTLLLALVSWGVFGLEDSSTKGTLTILNAILLIVPMVSIIFSTIYLYNSTEFIELLLSQPIQRKKIWSSVFLGLSLSMTSSFLIGCGIPLLIFTPFELAITMILTGVFISVIFVALAFFTVVNTRDKAKGIGISIMLWLFFAVIFDGIVLFLLFQFADYPIEKIMVGLTAFSPLDLARITILLKIDVSAMMGYTGAIFKDFFGSAWGMFISIVVMTLWVFLPFKYSLMKFKKMDL